VTEYSGGEVAEVGVVFDEDGADRAGFGCPEVCGSNSGGRWQFFFL